MGQFANDSMTPSPISVSLDQHMNEIPSDMPMHADATPGMSVGVNYGAVHYNDDVKPSGGGVQGPGVSRETKSINNNNRAEMRGPDA